eukprot:6736003-Lingulodinium_polyedra.AAC.1
MRCGRPPTRRLVHRMNTETPAVPCEDACQCLTRGGQWRLRTGWEGRRGRPTRCCARSPEGATRADDDGLARAEGPLWNPRLVASR